MTLKVRFCLSQREGFRARRQRCQHPSIEQRAGVQSLDGDGLVRGIQIDGDDTTWNIRNLYRSRAPGARAQMNRERVDHSIVVGGQHRWSASRRYAAARDCHNS